MLNENLKKYNRKRLIEMRYDVRLDTEKSTRIKIPDGKISRMPKVRSRQNISRRIPLVTRKANVRRGLAVVDATYDGVVLHGETRCYLTPSTALAPPDIYRTTNTYQLRGAPS